MEIIIILIVVVAAAFSIYAAIGQGKTRKALYTGGYVSNRSGAFWRQTQVYTTSAQFDGLFNSIKRFFPPGAEGRKSTDQEYMMFKGGDWEALLERSGEEAGKAVYEFQFTQYATTNGSVDNSEQLDAILTAVERAFLVEDPFTRYVTKQTVGLKSRPQLF